MEDEYHMDPTHDLKRGDHVIRWTWVYLYPIQIHGIVLSAGHDIVTICDFGLTGVKSKTSKNKNRTDFADEKMELEDMVDIEDKAMIDTCEAHKKENGTFDRINIITLVEEKEIKCWKKIGYGEPLVDKSSWLFWKKEDNEEECNPSIHTPRKKKLPKMQKSDPIAIVIARVRYLLNNQKDLPPHHLFFSNSECMAVWCKTGRWSTLQASIYLSSTAAGNLKTSIIAATGAAKATTVVTAPATGILGWFGFTTTSTVPLLSVTPWLVPVLAGYGIVMVGTPIVVLKKAQSKWEETTVKLNDGFWSAADPDVFVEAINSWSAL